MPAKHLDMQVAMKRHLPQSPATGAFAGQHGMSLAISSAVADMDISLTIAASGIVPAITGEDSGANTIPATMTIASRRRMVIWRFTPQNPTDEPKLKAFTANDDVMTVTIPGKACQAWPWKKLQQPKRLASLQVHHHTAGRLASERSSGTTTPVLLNWRTWD
jgi:hypothetical protein